MCCVYVTEERDSSNTKELSTDMSPLSVSESSTHTVCEMNCSVCLRDKFVEMQERSFRFMYRKYRKRTTLSGYDQQILFFKLWWNTSIKKLLVKIRKLIKRCQCTSDVFDCLIEWFLEWFEWLMWRDVLPLMQTVCNKSQTKWHFQYSLYSTGR